MSTNFFQENKRIEEHEHNTVMEIEIFNVDNICTRNFLKQQLVQIEKI